MLYGAENIDPYARQLLRIFLESAKNSPELTVSQKIIVEDLCQKIVDVWVSKDFK